MSELRQLIREIRKEVVLNENAFDESQGGRSSEISEDKLLERIEEVCFRKGYNSRFTAAQIKKVVDTVFNQMRRLDVIEPLVRDREITEIMINGPEHIFIEKGGILKKTDVVFESRERLEELIQSIVSRVNRSVNEADPVVDARLEDGSRVNVVLPPIALNGPLLTIRKFPEKAMTIEDLIRCQSLTEEAAHFLGQLVKARYNIFICGGTGSGKTSFLNALSSLIPGNERVITIEDSAELRLSSVENLVRLETRNSNSEGKGQIKMNALIKTALRMRPDRIIVGEVRGEEALDMLQCLNTGHDGSMSTGHANSSSDMLSRLETMVLMAAPLPMAAIRRQIGSALDIIVFLSRLRDHSRRTLSIAEVLEGQEGQLVLNPLFEFKYEDSEKGEVKGCLVRTNRPVVKTYKAQQRGILLD